MATPPHNSLSNDGHTNRIPSAMEPENAEITIFYLFSPARQIAFYMIQTRKIGLKANQIQADSPHHNQRKSRKSKSSNIIVKETQKQDKHSTTSSSSYKKHEFRACMHLVTIEYFTCSYICDRDPQKAKHESQYNNALSVCITIGTFRIINAIYPFLSHFKNCC